jgi:hypothetical protein
MWGSRDEKGISSILPVDSSQRELLRIKSCIVATQITDPVWNRMYINSLFI